MNFFFLMWNTLLLYSRVWSDSYYFLHPIWSGNATKYYQHFFFHSSHLRKKYIAHLCDVSDFESSRKFNEYVILHEIKAIIGIHLVHAGSLLVGKVRISKILLKLFFLFLFVAWKWWKNRKPILLPSLLNKQFHWK